MIHTKTWDSRVSVSEEMREDAAEDRRRFLAGVYRESGAQLYRYALMILAHRGDAEDVLQQVFAAALEQALKALPPEQREVVHLHVYEGMTFQEVANATGESINTVSARYRYAVDKMRRLLGPTG